MRKKKKRVNKNQLKHLLTIIKYRNKNKTRRAKKETDEKFNENNNIYFNLYLQLLYILYKY